MKKFLLGIGCVFAVVIGCVVFSSYSAAPPALSGCVGGSYYVQSVAFPIYYGKLDTLNGAATDTFKMPCGCKPVSINYTNDCWKVAGSPTVTVSLYGSANGGISYTTTPITTYTVAPGSLTAQVTNTYLINGPYGGNPFTNYMWVASNPASSTSSWQGYVTVR